MLWLTANSSHGVNCASSAPVMFMHYFFLLLFMMSDVSTQKISFCKQHWGTLFDRTSIIKLPVATHLFKHNASCLATDMWKILHDYVGEVTHYANFGFSRYSGGFFPYGRNITTSWLFWLSCPIPISRSYTHVEPLDRFSRFMAQTTCFCARMVLSGLGRWVTSFGEIFPRNAPKWAE